jgi:hypothetical protein
LKLPTDEQITRAAALLCELRERGNRRPGDNHIDHDIDVQLRARATDILVFTLNQDHVLNG